MFWIVSILIVCLDHENRCPKAAVCIRVCEMIVSGVLYPVRVFPMDARSSIGLRCVMLGLYNVWETFGKVRFLHLSVSLSSGGCIPACTWADTPGRHPPGRQPRADTPLGRHPPPADGYCSGRYASYWNAFLWIKVFRAVVDFSFFVQFSAKIIPTNRLPPHLGLAPPVKSFIHQNCVVNQTNILKCLYLTEMQYVQRSIKLRIYSFQWKRK